MDNNPITDVRPGAGARMDRWGVIVAGLLWGTGGLAGAILADHTGMDALAVAAFRLLIGGGLVVAWLALTGRLRMLRVGRAGRRRLITLGLLAAVFQSCYFAAVDLTSVSLATLVTLGSAPLLVVAGESLAARKWPSGRMVLAVVIAVTGLALLVGGPGSATPEGALAGTACALASGSGFAAMTMLAARPVAGLATLTTTGLAFCLGGVVVLPLAMLTGEVVVGIEPGTVGLLLYLGLVPTALAYTLYFGGLCSVLPGVAALVALLEPLTAAVLGAFVLDERLGTAGIVGAVLVGAALMTAASDP